MSGKYMALFAPLALSSHINAWVQSARELPRGGSWAKYPKLMAQLQRAGIAFAKGILPSALAHPLDDFKEKKSPLVIITESATRSFIR